MDVPPSPQDQDRLQSVCGGSLPDVRAYSATAGFPFALAPLPLLRGLLQRSSGSPLPSILAAVQGGSTFFPSWGQHPRFLNWCGPSYPSASWPLRVCTNFEALFAGGSCVLSLAPSLPSCSLPFTIDTRSYRVTETREYPNLPTGFVLGSKQRLIHD
jgi:hypothetical protein